MKIGILTHHYVKNYGAFLQMKGMYETVRELYPDADVKIINYTVKKHWMKNIIHILHYRVGIDSIPTYFQKVKQLMVFTKYERSIPRTNKVKTATDINKLGLDMIILGSDEIWNWYGSGYNKLKFGAGLEADTIISYAPSVGSVTDKSIIPEELKIGIERMSRISCRDSETIKFVMRVTKRSAVKLLDPTFLYNFDLDIKRENIKEKKEKYILIYDCKLTSDQVSELKNYATINNMKIIGAGDYKKYYDEVTICLSPYEWVNLFKGAERVITGTFHGTVFSIKYKKQFVCYPTEKHRINKITSLLEDMDLKNRWLELGKEEKFIDMLEKPVDYTKAYCYIENKQKEAKAFIQGE